MKKISLLALITCSILLSGCSYKIVKTEDTENNQNTNQNVITSSKNEEDLFNKKQECAKYLKTIEQKFVEEAEYALERRFSDEIFFSPKRNSCIYSYTSYSIDANGMPMDMKVMGKNYVIIDYLTNEQLLNANSVINTSAQSVYNDMKLELKK